MEVGADRKLVLRICPCYWKTVKISCADRHIVGDRELDAATDQDVGFGRSGNRHAKAGRAIGDDAVADRQAGLAQTLDIGRRSRATTKPLDGDFATDEHKLESCIGADIEAGAELRAP